MKTNRRYDSTMVTRLTLVCLAALGFAGAALLAGLGLLKWLCATGVLLLSPGEYTMALAVVAGMALALFTMTLVLGGLAATRRGRW